MRRLPCSTPDCRGLANAARRYCEECDFAGMPESWSRTRDEAWLAYESPTVEGNSATPQKSPRTGQKKPRNGALVYDDVRLRAGIIE